MRADSLSPLPQRSADQYYGAGYDRVMPRGRGLRGGRGPGRFRDVSPPYGRGRGARTFGRNFGGPNFESGPFRGEGFPRNNPNVSPREGDWICADPVCGNLNFARRSHCNNCRRPRFGPGDGPAIMSPKRKYPGPPSPRRPTSHIPGPTIDRSSGQEIDRYRSPPPRMWGKDGPVEFGMAPPPRRGRFMDDHIQRERRVYHEDGDYRERAKNGRLGTSEWGDRDSGTDLYHDRRAYSGRNERRHLSPTPPPLAYHDQWHRGVRDRSRTPIRERSCSPIRGRPKEFRRDVYMGR